MGPLGIQELIIILIMGSLLFVFTVIPFWFICKKAGFSPWLSLITLIPFGLVILPILLAAMDWPALRKADPQSSSSPPLA